MAESVRDTCYVMTTWGSATLFSDACKRDRIHKFYPLYFFVYTVQILIAFYAGVVFLRACGVTGEKDIFVLGSLALLTFPVPCKVIWPYCRILRDIPFTAGTVGGDPDPAAGCCGGGW